MFLEEKEKKSPPQVNGTKRLEGSGILKMRWETVVFLIFIIIIQLFAAWELYKNWNNFVKNINLRETVKSHENVAKLQFDSYLRDFSKTYNSEEYMRRFENFQESLEEIARLNELENNTVFGLTKFSDMSKEEFADRMLLRPFENDCRGVFFDCTARLQTQTQYKPQNYKKYGNKIPPTSFDWRLEGVVKPVLHQKLCNGCWAFSIVGVLESMTAIQLNDSRSRSIQELLDCSPDTKGCNKGSVSGAMKFACRYKLQFVTEEEYPMTLSMTQICKLPKTGYSGRMIKGYNIICKMDEDEMVKQIATHGPLIAVVDSSNWRNYIGGIITRACSRGVGNHVVQIVGYEGYYPKAPTILPRHTPYYIVKNSYGVGFGDNGYMKIAMKENVCGIAEQVTYMDVI